MDDQEEYRYCRELLERGALTVEGLMRERAAAYTAGRRSVQMEEAERLCQIAEAKMESSISGIRQKITYMITDQDRADVWALFRWRDIRTDLYGDEFMALMMNEFIHPTRQYPKEHSRALTALRRMTEADRFKLIQRYCEAGHED